MNFSLLSFVIICPLFLFGCSTTQFGVHQEQWIQMTDEQKKLVIEGYNQRQALIEQRRIEEKRAAAIAQEKENKRRYAQIEKIKKGEGVLGDYIRISILSCKAKINSKYRSINPVSIKLADGEYRVIEIKNESHKYRFYTTKLPFSYQDGLLIIGSKNGRGGIFLPYTQKWKKGHRYSNLSSKNGAVKLEDCNVEISVIPVHSF